MDKSKEQLCQKPIGKLLTNSWPTASLTVACRTQPHMFSSSIPITPYVLSIPLQFPGSKWPKMTAIQGKINEVGWERAMLKSFLASAEKYRYFSRLKLSVWHSLHGTPKRGGRGEKYKKRRRRPFLLAPIQLPPFLIFILNGLAIIHRVKTNQQMFSQCDFAAVCQGDQRNYYICELLRFLG